MLFIYKRSSFSVPGQKYFHERQASYLTAFNKNVMQKDKKKITIAKEGINSS